MHKGLTTATELTHETAEDQFHVTLKVLTYAVVSR